MDTVAIALNSAGHSDSLPLMKTNAPRKIPPLIAVVCTAVALPWLAAPSALADDEEHRERAEEREREREGDRRREAERDRERDGDRRREAELDREREMHPRHRFELLIRQLHEAMERGNNEVFHHTLRQLAETNEQIQHARRREHHEREHHEREAPLGEIIEEIERLHHAMAELQEQLHLLREEHEEEEEEDEEHEDDDEDHDHDDDDHE